MSDATSYTWKPSRDYLERSRVAGLMRRLGVSTADELRSRSIADVAWFWNEVVQDLGLAFRAPYHTVLDLTGGAEHPEWFVGGRINVVDATVERWARQTPDAVAVVHESEDGVVRSITFADLADQVARLRTGLRARGIGKGDAVVIYLPMTPEAVVATYAIASIGAIVVPLFSGFAPSAIAARVQDAGARAVITADGARRRRKVVPMKPLLDEALKACPAVELVVVVANTGEGIELVADRDVAWDDLIASTPDQDVESTAASDVLLLGYTSGTTGRPKGAVHTHAGFLVKTASEVAYGFDTSPGDVFCWITDLGWIMGPLSIIGTHANGGTLLVYDGSPDVPTASRLWQLVERHKVTMLGVSPTLIRTLRAASAKAPGTDLSSVRILGSTGEPWDPESYEWLARDVFGGRVPVINFSGGTEVGGSFLCPYPVEEIRSCSLGGPALGMDVEVVDDAGQPVRGSVGELVCRQPWPSMTRGVWKDEERYLQAYWSTFPGVWRHGDYALVGGKGSWFILGRSDDVMNVAGKRVAPAEIESVLAADPAIAECAVVGIPDEKKGEAVWAFWVRRSGDSSEEADVSNRLKAAVATELGKPFAPSKVVRVAALPKTRSAKILRRAVRAAVLDTDPGDLSAAENPEAVDDIRLQVKELASPPSGPGPR